MDRKICNNKFTRCFHKQKCYKYNFKNSLIIQEENTKKNHKRLVPYNYVIKNHVNLHKL